MERIFALVRNGVVENAIVADAKFAALVAAQYDHIEEVTDLTPRPAVGWMWSAAAGFAPAPSLTSSSPTVTADGTSTVTAQYTNRAAGAPASVTFDVNGATTTVPLANGVAELDITASTPGPIVVTAQGLSITITAKGA